jgi:hypothetical protein
MAIVGGFDIHRRQVTYDYLDTGTGQVRRGRIEPGVVLSSSRRVKKGPGRRPQSARQQRGSWSCAAGQPEPLDEIVSALI